MPESELDIELNELQSAEDFLDYFFIDYNQNIVHVNRLHILQRYHNYIAQVKQFPVNKKEQFMLYKNLLQSAYDDFVKSNALTEKVFKVFHMHEPREISIPLSDIKLPR